MASIGSLALYAFIPILIVLVLMIGLKWDSVRAGIVGLFASLCCSFLLGGDWRVVKEGVLKGMWDSFFILYMIIPLMMFYNILKAAGVMDKLKLVLSFSKDRMIIILAIGMMFPALIQGICGFGMPVAFVAPLLIELGINPISAVAIPLIGHNCAITFGSMGSTYMAFMRTTGYGEYEAAVGLVPAVSIGVILTLVTFLLFGYFNKSDLLGETKQRLYTGRSLTAMFITYLFVAIFIFGIVRVAPYGSPALAFLIAIGIIILLVRAFNISPAPIPLSRKEIFQALFPIVFLLGFAVIIFLPQVKPYIDSIGTGIPTGGSSTEYGFIRPPEASYGFTSFIRHPGFVILVILLILYLLGNRRLGWKEFSWKKVLKEALFKNTPSSALSLMVLMSFATVLLEVGGIEIIGNVIAGAVGSFYAFLSPWIGHLGSFMTGSDTSSTIIFSNLQVTTAEKVGLDPLTIGGGQVWGGQIGNITTPFNIVLGTTTAGILGKEGEVLRKVLPYAIFETVIAGIVIMALAGGF